MQNAVENPGFKMPIYEFYCRDNHRIYSFYARSLSHADAVPKCPDNPGYRMEKLLSGFAITGRAKDREGDAGGGQFDDPRIDAVMAEMEREMAGMDEENPDPRRLAGMMRKMTDLSGGKVPEPMQEMIARMEAGEDLEKLEEEFGDFGDGMDDMPGDGDGGDDGGDDMRRTLRRLRGRPRRDPALYELADFL